MEELADEVSRIKKLWDFNWGAMDVLIGGKSSIDLEKLQFKNWQDASVFIKYYGYDPDDEEDAQRIHCVIIEAWNFIERYLIPQEWNRGQRPPDDLLQYSDVRDIILAASDMRPDREIKQAWACSLLRVMHTIAHIEGVQRHADFRVARDQIMARFQEFIFRNSDGELRFGDKNQSIAVQDIEWKYDKPRESVILKLLHKKANVTETIYDFIGMRIIPKRLCDVLVVVKFLRDHHMVTFANCNPSRARNTLLDVESFRHNVESLKVMLENKKLSLEEFWNLLQRITRPLERATSRSNPHSGSTYRSIQLTCRQLIRMPSQAKRSEERLLNFMENSNIEGGGAKLLKQLAQLFREDQKESREVLGFFPFEIQIVDGDTYEKNKAGDANHSFYKQSQIKSARRRVLGKVIANKY
ncbi:MAG: TIGR04552 family protein [Pseudobacteriovorax sp.]|nr:TIGR04552 family protein [Pseudobacteriovorax sp.]